MTAAVFLNFAVRSQQDNVARVQRFGVEFLFVLLWYGFFGFFFSFFVYLFLRNWSRGQILFSKYQHVYKCLTMLKPIRNMLHITSSVKVIFSSAIVDFRINAVKVAPWLMKFMVCSGAANQVLKLLAFLSSITYRKAPRTLFRPLILLPAGVY